MKTQQRFAQIAELWKADKRQYVKKSSYATYVLLIENHLLPAFGDKSEICEQEVQAFVFQKLSNGLSQKSVKDALIVLKMILRFGAKHGLCEYTPFTVQYPTQREAREIGVLSKAHQKRLMAYIREHFTFRNLGVYICLSSGIRIGELCALTWADMDTDTGVIRIRRTIQRVYIMEHDRRRTELLLDTPKTKNSIRDIPMTRELLSLLKPIKRVVNESYFVLTNDAKPTEPRTYRNHYNRLLNDLGIPALKFHGLRHSFATRCIESNCDYKTVSVILGHSNISTTLNLYVHPNLEQKRKCIDQMARQIR